MSHAMCGEMSLIVPGLFLSCFRQAETLVDSDTFVVNCTSDLPMLSKNGLRIDVEDNGRPDETRRMIGLLPKAILHIHEQLTAGNKVVVHCTDGMQRSPAVVAAYLVAKRRMTAWEATEHVQRCHPEAFFWEARFEEAVEAMEGLKVDQGQSVQ